MKRLIKVFYNQLVTDSGLIIASVLIAGMLQGCTGEKGNEVLTVGEKGSLHCIVIPDQSDPVIRFAASELQSYLKKITGQELRIMESAGNKKGETAIHLSLENDKALKWDGYEIRTTFNDIRLASNEPRGLLYAVYTLLEESGCSFFYPGESEEKVPQSTIITFKPDTIIYNPELEHRGLAPYGLQANSAEHGRKLIDWMAKNRLNYILVSEDRPSDCDGPAHASIWKEVREELLSELQKRGFVIEMSEHCAPVFFPRSLFNEHPDWFALKDGKRKLGLPPYSGQMCYSNKEAVEYYATAIADYAAKHPEFHVIGTWPLDGGEYCECEQCKDPQTVFKAVKKVAEKVRIVRPDMIVEHLAYKVQTWQPPDTEKIPDNISVLWCPDMGEMDNLADKWIEKVKTGGGFYQFEYYMGDNYRARANVRLRPAYSAGVARHASEMGFRGVISLFLPIQNWWRASFNNWFFARACWDPNLDIELCIRKYCNDFYGNKASEAEKIFHLILSDLQPEPYKDQLTSASERLPYVRSSSEIILARLDSLASTPMEKDIALRLQRVRTYVEYSRLHAEAMASRRPADLERLASYSREHPEEEMVMMYPDYITWRNK
jgi:hypothetical protein